MVWKPPHNSTALNTPSPTKFSRRKIERGRKGWREREIREIGQNNRRFCVFASLKGKLQHACRHKG
jgi:hypothetical protein